MEGALCSCKFSLKYPELLFRCRTITNAFSKQGSCWCTCCLAVLTIPNLETNKSYICKLTNKQINKQTDEYCQSKFPRNVDYLQFL